MKKTNDSTKMAAEILKALGHPIRIEIIRFLTRSKKRSVKSIQENLGLSQVEASRHLIILKRVFVLNCEKDGTHSYYLINKNNSFIKQLIVCLSKSTL